MIADLPIGARGGLRHHRATAKEYCPFLSTAARHCTIFCDIAAWALPQPPEAASSRHFGSEAAPLTQPCVGHL
jgi:hypothetical protein